LKTRVIYEITLGQTHPKLVIVGPTRRALFITFEEIISHISLLTLKANCVEDVKNLGTFSLISLFTARFWGTFSFQVSNTFRKYGVHVLIITAE
jgi:hypothetical protein